MSDRVGLKTKDNAGKKFSSLNLSQTYKGTKVETKANTGVPRHGLQSLGKVAPSRRMPPPANLPSLKSENLGNDPTVALVPSGGGGWGSGKDKETSSLTSKTSSQKTNAAVRPQEQQPVKTTDPSQKTTTGQQINSAQKTSINQNCTATKTWGSNSSNVAGGQEKTSYPRQSQYFNQEFPTLRGGNSGDKLPEERVSHPPYGQPPRNTHDPPWMNKGGMGPPPPKPSIFGMYNGASNPGPPQRSGYGHQMYHRDGHPMNTHSQDFPYMGQSRPMHYAAHPAANQRGNPVFRHPGPLPPKHMIKLEDSPSGYVRPSVVNEDDIHAMDSEDVDEGGWAGAQEEIDYSVKLNFDDEESHVDDSEGKTSEEKINVAMIAKPKQPEERGMNGVNETLQVDEKYHPQHRQAWANQGSSGQRGFMPHWNDPRAQGQYNNAQRQWANEFPPQRSNAMQNMPTNRPGAEDSRAADHRTSNTSIEQARQRKQLEEEERKRQQESAAREKLRRLDERKRLVQTQQENNSREHSGRHSPISQAAGSSSDVQVRRIMQRKDSGSVGDDNRSIESIDAAVGANTSSQSNTYEELRNFANNFSLSSPVQGRGEIVKSDKTTDKKQHPEEVPSRQADDVTVETRKSSSGSRRDANDVEGEKRPERKDSECRPRNEEASRKKSETEINSSRSKNEFDRRKFDNKRGNRLSSRSERGSSDSLQSRDDSEKQQENRRRNEDIKRKREELERDSVFNEKVGRDRVSNKDRSYSSSRGRTSFGSKSHLRGHPKSYSHGRGGPTQRRTSTQSSTKPDDEHKTVVDDDEKVDGKSSVQRKGADSERGKTGSIDQREDKEQRPVENRERQQDDYRRPRGDRVPGEKRHELRGRDDPLKDKNGRGGRQSKEHSEMHYYNSKRAEKPGRNEDGKDYRDKRDTREERNYNRGSGRFPSRSQSTRDTGGRAERFRDKSRNTGGFGKPPVTEQRKDSKDEEDRHSNVNLTAAQDKSSENWDINWDIELKAKSSRQTNVSDPNLKPGSECDKSKPATASAKSGDNGKLLIEPVNQQDKQVGDDVNKEVSSMDNKELKSSERAEQRNEQTVNKDNTVRTRSGQREQDKKHRHSRGEMTNQVKHSVDGKPAEKHDSDGKLRQDVRRSEPRARQNRPSNSDEKRSVKEIVKQHGRMNEQSGGRNDTSSYRDRKGPRDQDKSHNRNRNDRGWLDRRVNAEHIGRREPLESHRDRGDNEGGDRRDRNEKKGKPLRQRDFDETSKTNAERLIEKNGINQNTDEADKRAENVVPKPSDEMFTIGSVSPSPQRHRPNERRGGPSYERGARGGTRGGRGRGRPIVRSVGSNVSKEDDEDIETYQSANSSLSSDISESEEELDKRKESSDKSTSRFYDSSQRIRMAPSSRGRGRGRPQQSSQRSRKPSDKPPRFQKQEARSASRGKGRISRGGLTHKENTDESRRKDEEPLSKKRPPDNTSSSGERNSSSFKGRRAVVRGGGRSGSRDSFLAKKQQEVVEGSLKKLSGRYSGKSTTPAALTTHGRRMKSEPSIIDVDENLEPPKKNPRRTEPQKVGIDHIDLSNIAGVIDVDDIAQPANVLEPASPQSDFVEVKSKRTQKEQKDRAREEEERRRRETEKKKQDAMMKPKTTKFNLPNKSSGKAPRFAKNAGTLPQSALVHSLSETGTSPRGETPAVSPENTSMQSVLSPSNVEVKRTSPLMLEKPSSPPPPPIFNAWTKPLSITPAKPPNHSNVDMLRESQPDPLAVGSGKPQRASGSHVKPEEPELQITVNLPDTFQAPPDGQEIVTQNSESRIFNDVRNPDVNKHSNADNRLKKGNMTVKTEHQGEIKQVGGRQSRMTAARQTGENKNNNGKVRASTVEEKSTENDKRQQKSNNWNSDRPPRFDRNNVGKRNAENRKLNSERSKSDAERQKEKNGNRARSGSRGRDQSKQSKTKMAVKSAKPQHSYENRDPNIENIMVKGKGDKNDPAVRDSVELDVESMSESLLDETSLGVHMTETSETTTTANTSISYGPEMKTVDDFKLDFEMHEKMEAAKIAWNHTTSLQTSKWKTSPVTSEESSVSSEGSVVDQISRASTEQEGNTTEPLATTSRMKKTSEQQNVCKVKPQQQQQQVKPQTVPTETSEDYSSGRSVLDVGVQPTYSLPHRPSAIFTSKPQTQGYTYSFEQQALVPINHQYVQTDMSSIQQHVSTVRPQSSQTASQSQRSASYPAEQAVSTPSPLSHQPLLQDTHRPLFQATALYSASPFAGNNPYYPMSVLRAAQPQIQASVTEDMNNSMYTVQAASKTQNPGYETSVPPTPQQVFLPSYGPEYIQSQHQSHVGYYSDSQNQANTSTPPVHRGQRDNRSEQRYTPPGQSEMSKHVHAKPFQPPSSSPPGGTTQQITPNVHRVANGSGPTGIAAPYHLNSAAVLSLQSAGSKPLQGTVSSSNISAISPIITQTHSMPRLGFPPFPNAIGSFPRRVQVPVQQLPTPTYPAGIAYRSTVPGYSAPTSVPSQASGVIIHKPTPVVGQIISAGRPSPVSHRIQDPIQRPNKIAFHPGTVKEKQMNAQTRIKVAPNRRPFNVAGAQPGQIPAYQLQTLPRAQTPPQQQQQIFRNQQHQQMLSNVQQFFAEDKEHQKKQKQSNQKAVVMNQPSNSNDIVATTDQTTEDKRRQATKPETKPQKSTKDDQVKKRRQPERKGVRTAQITPQRNQSRPQNRSKPSGMKVESPRSVKAVGPGNTAPKVDANIETPSTEVSTA